ncbi:E3 ubiquitin-protein ligase ICP0 [Porphyridium purpureum]|uniref:E3 ubiquitin-protein ligase ICP0 n=1 Tax=Porphyridium purpureum TaxID=35688 RepID=A0A5J4YYB3_PORPP|nr:E3 ubiquitin-protein ligase ICP0 [Porphyridium purpureum]|eukprot:POR7130..scf208_2
MDTGHSDCNDDAPGCAICMAERADIAEDELAMLPCGHVFCIHCLVSWSLLQCKCPLCTAAFSTMTVRRDPSTGRPLSYGGEAGGSGDDAAELAWFECAVGTMQRASWVRITELCSAREDIMASIHLQNSVAYALADGRGDSTLLYQRSEQHEDELEEACFAEAGELWESSRRAMRQGAGSGRKSREKNSLGATSLQTAQTGPIQRGSGNALHWERVMNRPAAMPSASSSSSRKGKRNRAQVVI